MALDQDNNAPHAQPNSRPLAANANATGKPDTMKTSNTANMMGGSHSTGMIGMVYVRVCALRSVASFLISSENTCMPSRVNPSTINALAGQRIRPPESGEYSLTTKD